MTRLLLAVVIPFCFSDFAYCGQSDEFSVSASAKLDEPFSKIVVAMKHSHPSLVREEDEYEITIGIPGLGDQLFDCKRTCFWKEDEFSVYVHAYNDNGEFDFTTTVTADGNLKHVLKSKTQHVSRLKISAMFRTRVKIIDGSISKSIDELIELQPLGLWIPPPKEKFGEVEWSKYLAKHLDLQESDCEYRLPNGSRIDIYDKKSKIAYEVEWSDKWPESIGQSNFYADATGATPGVILLLRGNYEEDWLECLSAVVRQRKSSDFKFYYIMTGE